MYFLDQAVSCPVTVPSSPFAQATASLPALHWLLRLKNSPCAAPICLPSEFTAAVCRVFFLPTPLRPVVYKNLLKTWMVQVYFNSLDFYPFLTGYNFIIILSMLLGFFFWNFQKQVQLNEYETDLYRVFKLDLHQNKRLLGHEKCTFKS